MFVTSLVLLLATNIWIYSAIKFFVGVWWSTIGTCVFVLLTEKVCSKWRVKTGLLEILYFNLGYMSLPGLGYLLRNSSWKYLYLCSSLPCIFVYVFSYFFVNESPRWILMQGKEKELFAMLKRGNRKSNFPPSETNFPLPAQEQISFFQLLTHVRDHFKDKWTLKRTALVMFLGIGIVGVYLGIPLAVETLGFNIYLSAFLTTIMKIPLFIATYFMRGFK
ncbi:putative major facilitator, sugar transporter, major facilitator superfamily [Medicago truncatula]|uniref:Putative major facilitator, sugar transporter, major facilitator superfamily n=1 Tax=Medicago truncatula TaxID=3880 RepID=A0A396IFE4_MEDTR|nr:putative major facilitator, sugar transporter, major facilitator superfamily [Medicago truncatula]